MKKSSGTPTRTNLRGLDVTTIRHEPAQSGKGLRRWRGYLAAGGAVILLILMILPCQYRRCGGSRNQGTYAYRWIVSGIPSGLAEKAPLHTAKGPDHGVRKMLLALKRTAPHRGTVPVEKHGKKDQDNAEERRAMKHPESDKQPEKIETGKGRVVKPKVYDFGTKLELVMPPEKR